jgi:large subunit ribosomal protein L11
MKMHSPHVALVLVSAWCIGTVASYKAAAQVTKTPPTTYFVKKAAAIESGSSRPGHQSVATVSAKHVYEIAKIKAQDSMEIPLESVCRNIVGTCRSMGVKVVGRLEEPEASASI